MDPYLENPELWPDVHHEIISVAREFLNEELGHNYYARIEERVYISGDDDPGRPFIIPDIRIGKKKGKGRAVERGKEVKPDVAEPMVVTTLLDNEIHEARIEIIDKKDRRLVAVIEVVSPSNKTAGSRGRESYQKKRVEIMNSPSHWVEIDLLRSGEPVIPRVLVSQGDYLVHVSRVEQRPKGLVWPILLTQRLPVVTIPLKSPDPDARLDLQRVLDTAYDRADYDRTVDYRKPPIVRLPRRYAEWANRLLKSKGLR
jgi:hypothetical protein